LDVTVTTTGLQPACVSEQAAYQGSFFVHPGATAKGFGVQTSLPPLTTWDSGTIKCIACCDRNQDPLPAVLVP
jgi:hypothetical protein